MKISRLLRISRPRFWTYEAGTYVVGIAAAYAGVYSVWTMLPVIIFFLFFLYPANIYIYGINDVYDYETDRLNPKKVSYESLVEPREHRGLLSHILLISLPFAIYAFLTLSLTTFLSLLGFFFFAGFYSAPPIRAKARAYFDSFFSAGHYVITALFAYLLTSELLDVAVNWQSVYPALVAGMCWAIAMHAYSAVPDIKADQEAGLQTIATKLGKRSTLYLCASLYAIAGLISMLYFGVIGLLLALVYLLLMWQSLRAESEEKLFSIYTYFPKINSVIGMIIFFLLLFKVF